MCKNKTTTCKFFHPLVPTRQVQQQPRVMFQQQQQRPYIQMPKQQMQYCKNFNTDNGCQFGSECKFPHPVRECNNYFKYDDNGTRIGVCERKQFCSFSHHKLQEQQQVQQQQVQQQRQQHQQHQPVGLISITEEKLQEFIKIKESYDQLKKTYDVLNNDHELIKKDQEQMKLNFDRLREKLMGLEKAVKAQ